MTTPEDEAKPGPGPAPVVDEKEAQRAARRARRRARRLMQEAETWEEHSATNGAVPPPDEIKPGKRRQDVMNVIAARVKREKRAEEAVDGAAAETPSPQTEAAPEATIEEPRQEIRSGESLPATTPIAGGAVAKVGDDQPPPPPGGSIFDTREEEIAAIQRELVQRRRSRFLLLWLRLAFFVVLPTFLVGNYYYNHATDLYSTKSNFKIQAAAASGDPAMAQAATLAASSDAIAIQDFLTSREAMRIVDSEFDLIAHYQDVTVDPIQRLEADASENDAYALYSDRVLIGFDLAEGIIRMEVIDADPEMALALSNRMIELAEGRVEEMSDRTEQSTVANAQKVLEDAEAALDEAYEEVLVLQEQLGIFSTETEISLIQGQISNLTGQLQDRELSRVALLENPRPNQTQLRILDAEIERLRDAIAEQRGLIVNAQEGSASLARISAEVSRAEAELETRRALQLAAFEGVDAARREADRRSIFLARAVNPVLPVTPSYPRAFEYTVLSFIIFFAAYLIVSLTISILREQMSYGEVTS